MKRSAVQMQDGDSDGTVRRSKRMAVAPLKFINEYPPDTCADDFKEWELDSNDGEEGEPEYDSAGELYDDGWTPNENSSSSDFVPSSSISSSSVDETTAEQLRTLCKTELLALRGNAEAHKDMVHALLALFKEQSDDMPCARDLHINLLIDVMAKLFPQRTSTLFQTVEDMAEKWLSMQEHEREGGIETECEEDDCDSVSSSSEGETVSELSNYSTFDDEEDSADISEEEDR